MARFLFHMADGVDTGGLDGHEHPDFEDARIAAVRLLGERLAAAPERFEQDAYWRLEVATEDGLTMTVFHVSEVSAPAVRRRAD